MLRCISKGEAGYVMTKVHEGVCKNHLRGRSFAAKIIRAGYYRCKTIYKKIHPMPAAIPNTLPEELRSITSLWPFAQWGIDLVDLMPLIKRGTKFIIVIVGYFTK